MSEQDRTHEEFENLPFHEYCAHCERKFDDTVLDPTVTIVETDDGRAIHSFCDEECLSNWVAEE